MSTQKKWKLAQMLCLAVMLAGIIGLGVSVFGEAGPRRALGHRHPGGPVGQPDVRSGPAPPEGEVSGHSKSNGADVRRRPQQARRSAAAPWREETAEALRCGAAWRASWPNTAGRGSERP